MVSSSQQDQPETHGDDQSDLEVIKLRYQVKNLQKTNEVLSKKLDNVSKGHKELSREHASLQSSLCRMGVAEQQLVEELLSKVREKDTLKSELEKVLRERDELELMVHSLDVNTEEEEDNQECPDELIKVPDSVSLNNCEVGCQCDEGEHQKSTTHLGTKVQLSLQSGSGHLQSVVSSTEDQQPSGQEMMNSGFVNSLTDYDSIENNEHQALLRKRHMRSKSFRGRDFDLDEEPKAPVSKKTAAEAPQEMLSAFQLEGDESLPRPAPIRTSSMNRLRRKAAQQAASEIEEEQEEVKEAKEESKSWGWGMGSVGGLLKKVAADVAEDVKGLAGSLQQAFHDDDGYESLQHDDTGEVEEEAHTVEGEENHMRGRILERLQGEDTSLEMGLKAIDDQMENLTAGVGKALGSFWGGLGGAVKGAQSLASKVESAAKTTGKEITGSVEGGNKDHEELSAVKKAQSGFRAAVGMGGKLAQKAEQQIENMGRRAFALLEHNGAPTHANIDTEEAEVITFDSSFYIYGGQQHYEALEGLCNDCAKKCNKTRASLDGPQREELDDMLTFLHPIFEVEGSPTESEDEDGDSKTVDPRFTAIYSLVNALTLGSNEKASAMVLRAENQLQEWVDESAEVPSPPSSPGSLDSPGSVHPLLKVEASVASSEGRQILQQIHEEGIKRLAELCTCCMDGLLQVGKSLKQEQAGQETMDWPKGCEETSNLLRGYTVRLVHDLEAVAGAYVEALLGVGTSCQETLGDSSLRQKSSWLASDLEVDAGTAVGRIKDGFRNLLYVVLCTMLTGEESS